MKLLKLLKQTTYKTLVSDPGKRHVHGQTSTQERQGIIVRHTSNLADKSCQKCVLLPYPADL